ncbi:MAG: NAD-dependent epimerase/dehydratase family protein [Candidatus Sericytochromatia bacterium]|nr:NAD-dependent epimerase/dehydratase family protein [Candidatus Sericytochromatia bacterium]
MVDLNSKSIIETDSEFICRTIDFIPLENKTVLITGASGLLGVYFLTCLKLISETIQGIKIIAVFRSELPEYLSEKEFNNLSVFKGDISDSLFCETLPKADFIIHAAGYGQPLKFMSAPVKTIKLNTFTTFLLFDKLKTNGNFLFISSSEVYNGLSGKIYKESQIGTTNTTDSRACYIEGKRGGEAICNSYRQQGVNASSVRLGHTYGPGTKKGDKRVILSFIEKALKGKITLMDKGEAVRTYCYISDAVEIMWKILLSCKEPIYNLGGISKMNIAGVAQTIANIINVPVIIPQDVNSVVGAPEDVQLDMKLVTNEFGKNTFVSFEEGIKKTVDWYKSLEEK